MDRLAWLAKGANAPKPSLVSLGAKLRPHELIALLTHHYTKARARSLPPVTTHLHVLDAHGRQAVTIEMGPGTRG